ncbi:alpha/beta fold hydrolase [Dyella monticola]|nr:alpha/beta hydrolase [Dyella monticola]
MTNPSTSHWVEVEHARLHVEEAGEGEPITMLHGFLVDSGQWNNEFAALADSHHVIRYDARGFGRSTIEPGRYAHHEDLAAVLDACNVQRTALLACSGGAATALDFSLAHPERVSALIFVGAGYWGRFANSTPAARAFGQALASFDVNGLIDSSLRAFTDGPRRAQSDVDVAVRNHVEAMTTHLFKRNISYWTFATRDQRTPKPAALDRLHEVDAPTVLIVGREDQIEVHHLAKELRDGMPRARMIVAQGAGHHANLEAPAQVLGIVRDALSEAALRD